jgi:hypothetical protein
MTEPAAETDTIPDLRIYFPPAIRPKPSTITPSRKRSGIYSHNPILEQDATELWRYLMSNLKKPQMVVRVTGKTKCSEDDIVDFSVSIDVTNLIIPQWSRILTTDGTSTISRTIEKYTSSSYPFKEFRLKKVVVWDRERVTKLIVDVVTAAGYSTQGKHQSRSITVDFDMKDEQVMVFGSNWISRSAYNKYVRCLCYASCLCCVFCPAWHLARGRKKHRLECEYGMAVRADDFIANNRRQIYDTVVAKFGGGS